MKEHSLALKGTLLFVATLTIMAGTTVAPSLPAIEQTFAGTEHVALLSRMVLTLPAIFVAMSAPIAGILADRFGRKKLLIISMVLYGFSGMSGLLADNLFFLLVGRAVLGLAIGGIMTVGTTLAGDYFTGTERESYLGLQQAFTQFGGVAFVVTGGILADIHWRVPFAIYAASFLILPAVLAFLSEPAKKTAPSGGPAKAVVSANWSQVLLLALSTYLINVLFYTVPSQLPFFLRHLEINSASAIGYAIGTFNLAGALVAMSFGLLRSRLAVPGILAGGLALMATGFLMLAQASGMVSALVALCVLGTGLGVVMPSIMSLTIKIAPPALRGRIAGLVTASMFLGHFTSPLASQPWIGWFGFEALYRDISIAFAAMAVIAIAAASVRRWAV
ncbi:MFS transporter [Rhizobium sp. CG4]|uniref:MFS transporter n=1 Tax=Rhizobium sp. CG4 TaxID=2726075 RepID=UPI002033FD6C|nr:MFS transporter [Rhizobium sp. CG4]MCM2455144.1 MFS transporter [Rhizobium sp. CG4]